MGSAAQRRGTGSTAACSATRQPRSVGPARCADTAKRAWQRLGQAALRKRWQGKVRSGRWCVFGGGAANGPGRSAWGVLESATGWRALRFRNICTARRLGKRWVAACGGPGARTYPVDAHRSAARLAWGQQCRAAARATRCGARGGGLDEVVVRRASGQMRSRRLVVRGRARFVDGVNARVYFWLAQRLARPPAGRSASGRGGRTGSTLAAGRRCSQHEHEHGQ
jgi:hypothetical protein